MGSVGELLVREKFFCTAEAPFRPLDIPDPFAGPPTAPRKDSAFRGTRAAGAGEAGTSFVLLLGSLPASLAASWELYPEYVSWSVLLFRRDPQLYQGRQGPRAQITAACGQFLYLNT
eukprot:2303227-Rhodomonas_salina.3